MQHVPPISFSADISQFQYCLLRSPHSFLPSQSNRFDPNDTFRSLATCKTSTAQIAGKKISSQTAVFTDSTEHPFPRPIAIQIVRKTHKPEEEKPIFLGKKIPTGTAKLKEKESLKHSMSVPDVVPQKKPLVPRIPHKPIKPRSVQVSENPQTAEKAKPAPKPVRTDRVKSLVKQSIRTTQAEVEKKQSMELAKAEERAKRQSALETRAREIREMNRKATKQVFVPKYAWGVNPVRIQDEEKWRSEARLEKEKRAEARSKSSKQTEDMRLISHMLREHSLLKEAPPSFSTGQNPSNPHSPRKQRSADVINYMRRQQMKRREQSQNEELESLAQEAKRVTRLKQLEAKEKRRLEAHKRKKNKTESLLPKPRKRRSRKRSSKQISAFSDQKDLFLESSSNSSELENHKELLQTLLQRKQNSILSSHSEGGGSFPSSNQDWENQQRALEENRQKIAEYKRRILARKKAAEIEEKSEDSSEEMERNIAAVKIQAMVRMHQARGRYKKLLGQIQAAAGMSSKSFESSSPSVTESFLNYLHDQSLKPSLSFTHPSPPAVGQHLSPKEIQHRIDLETRNLQMTLAEEEKVTQERSQLSIVDPGSTDQLSLLQVSHQEDKAQFGALVKEICGEDQEALATEIQKAYEDLIDRRYDQLHQLFSLQQQRTESILREIPPVMDVSKPSDNTSSFEGVKPTEESQKDLSLDDRIEYAIGTATSKEIERATEEEIAQIQQTAAMRAQSPQARPENPLSFLDVDSPSPSDALCRLADGSPAWEESLKNRYESMRMNPEELFILDQLRNADLSPGRSLSPEIDETGDRALSFGSPTDLRDVISPDVDPEPSTPGVRLIDRATDIITDEILSFLLGEIADLQVAEARALAFDNIPRLSVSSDALLREQEGLRPEFAVRTDDDSVCELAQEILSSCVPDLRTNLSRPLIRNPLFVLTRLQSVDLGLLPKDPTPVDVIPEGKYASIEENRNLEYLGKVPGSLKQTCLDSHQIHDKLVFDAVNEALGNCRIYGNKGIPMPWSPALRKITRAVDDQAAQVLALREICLWNSKRLGIIPQLDGSQSQRNDEIVQLQREDRLVQDIIEETLAKDLEWCEYEDEETQTKLDLADMVLQTLMDELREIAF